MKTHAMRNQCLRSTTTAMGEQLEAYVALLRHLAHPNIVEITHYTRRGSQSEAHLDLPCTPTLEEWLSSDPPNQSRLRVAASLASTLHFVAGRGYGVAKLTPDAVLVRDDHSVVVVDLLTASRSTAETQTLQTLRKLLQPFAITPDPLRLRARGEAIPAPFPDLAKAQSLSEVSEILATAVRREIPEPHRSRPLRGWLHRRILSRIHFPRTSSTRHRGRVIASCGTISLLLVVSLYLYATTNQEHPASSAPVFSIKPEATPAPTTSTTASAPIQHQGDVYEVRGNTTTPLIGDWGCDGAPFPVVFQASNQQLYAFPHWAGQDRPVVGVAIHQVSTPTDFSLVREGSCDVLLASDTSGSRALDVRALLQQAEDVS